MDLPKRWIHTKNVNLPKGSISKIDVSEMWTSWPTRFLPIYSVFQRKRFAQKKGYASGKND